MSKRNAEKIIAEKYIKEGYLVIINGQPDIIAVKNHKNHGEIVFDEVKRGKYAYLQPNQERAATILRKLEGKPVYIIYKSSKLNHNTLDITITKERPVCPKCGTSSSRKFGYNHKGKQRYQCKKCGNTFIAPKDRVRQPPKYACLYCNSSNTIWFGRTFLSGGREKRRLKCKDCGRSYYPPEEVAHVSEKPICPECGSNDYYKAGFTSRKKQRYKCKSCGRNFIFPRET